MSKKLTITVIGMMIAGLTFAAARPEPIPYKLTEVRSQSWYAQKFASWKSYLLANPEDTEGWIYCYRAAEFAQSDESALQEIVEAFPTDHQASTAYFWLQSKQKGWTKQGIEQLGQACENVAEKELLPEKILLSEVKGNNRTRYSKLMDASGLIYPSLMNYSYNVLMSVADNGYLFVNSENTTIPLWVLQDVHGIRKDVRILSLDLLKNEAYRTRALAELIVPEEISNLLELPDHNPDKSFFYALTLPSQTTASLEDKLYIVGLASQISQTEIDNYARLKENIEDKFLLDYLTVDFNGEPKYATGKTLEQNYIVPFYLLKQYYDRINDEEKSGYWEQEIMKLADKSNISTRVKFLLDESKESVEFKKTDIDVKELDKKMRQIKDNLYASSVEVTNIEYGDFLDYLNENGYNELYETAKIDLDKYDYINRKFHEDYHYYYNKYKENFAQYPTMDLTHEAALLYCDWLTSQYNQQEKRQFKKVKFRLPTQNEWQLMALGYSDFQSWKLDENKVVAKLKEGKSAKSEEFEVKGNEVLYPWYIGSWEYRNKIRNQHGCYLANVKTEDKVYCKAGIEGDGYKITSPVGTYFPNGMGFFDMVGNVAEMIDIPGKAMGGSWDHDESESTIRSVNKYEKADPRVGFRVFMEVIEE
jgi:formylglycine-generating enzyme required for sulfatase activity